MALQYDYRVSGVIAKDTDVLGRLRYSMHEASTYECCH